MEEVIHSRNNNHRTTRCFQDVPAELFLLLVLVYCMGVSCTKKNENKTLLGKEYPKTEADSIVVKKLTALANYYYDYLGDEKIADSLSDEAIHIAEMSFRPAFQLNAYFSYFDNNEFDLSNFKKAQDYGLKAIQIAGMLNDPEKEWRAYKNLVKLYLAVNKFNMALQYSYAAIGRARAMENNALSAESYLLFARSLEGKNQQDLANNYYQNATELAEKLKDPVLQIKCYHELFRFYLANKLFNQALLYKWKEGQLVKSIFWMDTIKQMWIEWDLLSIQRNMNVPLEEKKFREILDFSIRHKADRLKEYTFALYRSYLLDEDKIDRLYELYNKQYPFELKLLSHQNAAVYYRLQAFFKEKENLPDSALYYFDKAEQLMVKMPDLKLSQFYYRFGQFLVRHNHNREAIDKFIQSYKVAREVPYFDYMLNASSQLEKLYSQMGDFRNAYKYSVNVRELIDSISTLSKREQIMKDNINREQQVRQKNIDLQNLENERKMSQQRTEKNTMEGVVVFLFILSFVIFRNYRSQKRSNIKLDEEKKRSERLLLNILPAETAEELKQTGSAKAKYFKEVTVMFTDFINFTQTSEKMTADELVKEINFYFSEFDKIISKYGIEKIKTIGDSYMCVGGLPVSNESHAHDVVSAALELQEFMEIQKLLRARNNRIWFEARIGIQSGPVVAGIVGTRKFAYDIWGNTVNAASTLEASGEPGKVNISGYTYNLVKDYFSCTYRGKIQTKHKGMMDMYFVNPLPSH
jgi:class 3 adenylate cyclase